MNKKTPFTISRTFDAPQALVWKVHTEAEHLMHWWGPKGMNMKHASVDLKPGGMFLYGIDAPDGSEIWGRFVYQEISPISKLVYVTSFSDKNGGITRHPMAPTWPAEMMTVVELSEENGKTTLKLTSWPVNAAPHEEEIFYGSFESMKGGFGGTYDKLT